MTLPLARPVASSPEPRIACIHQPNSANLPLTIYAKASDK